MQCAIWDLFICLAGELRAHAHTQLYIVSEVSSRCACMLWMQAGKRAGRVRGTRHVHYSGDDGGGGTDVEAGSTAARHAGSSLTSSSRGRHSRAGASATAGSRASSRAGLVEGGIRLRTAGSGRWLRYGSVRARAVRRPGKLYRNSVAAAARMVGQARASAAERFARYNRNNDDDDIVPPSLFRGGVQRALRRLKAEKASRVAVGWMADAAGLLADMRREMCRLEAAYTAETGHPPPAPAWDAMGAALGGGPSLALDLARWVTGCVDCALCVADCLDGAGAGGGGDSQSWWLHVLLCCASCLVHAVALPLLGAPAHPLASALPSSTVPHLLPCVTPHLAQAAAQGGLCGRTAAGGGVAHGRGCGARDGGPRAGGGGGRGCGGPGGTGGCGGLWCGCADWGGVGGHRVMARWLHPSAGGGCGTCRNPVP